MAEDDDADKLELVLMLATESSGNDAWLLLLLLLLVLVLLLLASCPDWLASGASSASPTNVDELKLFDFISRSLTRKKIGKFGEIALELL